MTRMIAIANQKGGCAKTSTAVNLAAGFARQGNKSVLLIDIDPQANATAVFMGIEFAAGPRQKGTYTIYEVITGAVSAPEALYRVELEPVGNKDTAVFRDILPARLDLASAELNCNQAEIRTFLGTKTVIFLSSRMEFRIRDLWELAESISDCLA